MIATPQNKSLMNQLVGRAISSRLPPGNGGGAGWALDTTLAAPGGGSGQALGGSQHFGPVFLQLYGLEMRKQSLTSPSCLQPQPGRPQSPFKQPRALHSALTPLPVMGCTLQVIGVALREMERPRSCNQQACASTTML